MKKTPLISWSLFDFGESAYHAIIQTFLFATYFTSQIAPTEEIGASLWGLTNAVASLAVAITAPFLGAIADYAGHQKKWVAFFSFSCILSTALMWFIVPGQNLVIPALILVAIATYGAESAFIFYNATLSRLATRSTIGKWSGYGWALGYTGGMLSMLAALSVIYFSSEESTLPIRFGFVIAALWYLIFSLPFYLFVPPIKGRVKGYRLAVRRGISQLKKTFIHFKSHPSMPFFFISRIFYIDALITLFMFSGIFASKYYDFESWQILLFGISLHIPAGIGAFVFGLADDRLGSRRVLVISIFGLFSCLLCILLFHTLMSFLLFSQFAAIFVGPIQSASRSWLAKMAPIEWQNELFGFFTLAGKGTSFLGPLLVSWITSLSGSLRLGMSVILLLLVVGYILLRWVPEVDKENRSIKPASRL